MALILLVLILFLIVKVALDTNTTTSNVVVHKEVYIKYILNLKWLLEKRSTSVSVHACRLFVAANH